jgi:uncharacterized protein YcbK (DUF882 family)
MRQHKQVLWTRRQFAVTVVSAVPAVCAARSWDPTGTESHRQLALANLHTGEELTVSFHDASAMAPRDAAALRHLLRDYRVNEEHEMDVGLFLQLTELAREARVPAVYEVISGYRSPGTNATLRAGGHHVAEHSQHMLGRAMDVRLRDCSLSRLHDLALSAQRGGVGYYPRSNFVHIDTGRVRSWQE